jgi:23S rRNA (pseudouridine1915-N3)-methyltransferase
MEVRVFWIGKTRLPGVAALTEEYSKRLCRFCEFRAEEVRPGSRKTGGAAKDALGKEESVMLARAAGSHVVALDPCGRQWNSQEFAEFLKGKREGAKRAVSFCVGGAEGFSPGFRAEADFLLSLSPLTLPHELARIVLLEQIYRAWTLLAHHPYPR